MEHLPVSQRPFDVIVIGAGAMGSAALYELARRGRRVLGFEQFTPVHDRGSSHGRTRIIRKAYYEHPDYVPLLKRAYSRWYDLEVASGKHLLTECPCLSIGLPDSATILGVRASADEHGLEVDSLDAREIAKRYPQFRIDEPYVGELERGAGILAVEDCVRTHLSEAVRLGATLHGEETVVSWEVRGQQVAVRTDRAFYLAHKLVIAAGPWSARMLHEIGRPLRVMRQVMFWFGTADDRRFRRDRFPIFLVETPDRSFYGTPITDTMGLKVAEHYGAPELLTPEEVDRVVAASDLTHPGEFVRTWLHDATGPVRDSKVCTYTTTPDRHFLIDVHPDHSRVCFAAGFSGHGFKFASVVGEILADLADEGRTALPIGRFRLRDFPPDSGPV